MTVLIIALDEILKMSTGQNWKFLSDSVIGSKTGIGLRSGIAYLCIDKNIMCSHVRSMIRRACAIPSTVYVLAGRLVMP